MKFGQLHNNRKLLRMIEYTLQPKQAAIDTSEIWRSMVQNRNNISSDLIWDYKENLSHSLRSNEDIAPDQIYNWKNWRYFKNKYEIAFSDYSNTDPFLVSHTFKLNYLSETIQENQFPASHTDLKLLSTEDKLVFILGKNRKTFDLIQPYPKESNSTEFDSDAISLFDSLVDSKEVSSSIKQSLFDSRQIENPIKWFFSGYDIFQMSQKQILKWDENDDFFLHSLLWFLIFLDPKFYRNGFLLTLCKENNKTSYWLKDILSLLRLKYNDVYKLVDLEEKSNLMPKGNDLKATVPNSVPVQSPNTPGRPKNTFTLPNPPNRSELGEITKLSHDETVALFSYLLKTEYIIDDKNILSNQTLGKIIKSLTGYSQETSARKVRKKKFSKETLLSLKGKIIQITSLISRDL